MTQPDLVWSDERPIESGNYWLSVHPDKRGEEWCEVEYVRLAVYRHNHNQAKRISVYVEPPGMDCDSPVDLWAPIFDGAKWAKRSLPFDPFIARRIDEDTHTKPHLQRTGAVFALHLEHASALIQNWPEWKQQVLGGASREQVARRASPDAATKPTCS